MKIESRRQSEKKIEVKDLDDLKKVLERHKIDYMSWGGSGAQGSKTIEDLFNETQTNDSELVLRGEQLVRKLRVLGFLVTYTDPQKGKLVLREQHQYFHDDGRGRIRTKWASVSEKLKTYEEPDNESIQRTLEEELSISGSPQEISFMGVDVSAEKEEKKSGSFFGLTTEYPMHKYLIELDKEQYIPEGYCEAQKNKTTCFHWEPIGKIEHQDQIVEKKSTPIETTGNFSDIVFDPNNAPQKFVTLTDPSGNTYVVSYPAKTGNTLHIHALLKGAPKFRSQGKDVTKAGGGVLRRDGNIIYIGGRSTQLGDFDKIKVRETLEKEFPGIQVLEE